MILGLTGPSISLLTTTFLDLKDFLGLTNDVGLGRGGVWYVNSLKKNLGYYASVGRTYVAGTCVWLLDRPLVPQGRWWTPFLFLVTTSKEDSVFPNHLVCSGYRVVPSLQQPFQPTSSPTSTHSRPVVHPLLVLLLLIIVYIVDRS